MDVQELMSSLKLEPLPGEGGFFRETYRADERVSGLPSRYGSEERSFSTAIYYLLTPDTFSALHRLPTDEIYHFYLGDPVEMLQLRTDGTGVVTLLGHDLRRGMRPQVVVPRGAWQGSRLMDGGRFALLGTTMAPAFEFRDFEAGVYAELAHSYPEHVMLIRQLIREQH